MPRGVPRSGVRSPRKPRGPKVHVGENGQPEPTESKGIGDTPPAAAKKANAAPANNGPSDAVLQRHFRLLSDAKTALDEAGAVYRAKLKAAKADGCVQGEMIATMTAKKKDIDEVIFRLKTRLHYHEVMGMPVGTQLGLFTGPNLSAEDAQVQADWAAAAAGYHAGRTGAGRNDNPHVAGSAGFAAWDKAYLNGQATIAASMGENAKVASIRKRGKKEPAGDAPAPPSDEKPRHLLM
jgi:hypothetical protein